MSKQRKQEMAKNAPKKGPQPKTTSNNTLPFLQNTRQQSIVLFAVAFVLYANTLFHGFVLDDSIVINDNMYTKAGVHGIPGIFSKDTFFGFFKVEGKAALVAGGRYRPLTLAMFALVYQIAGENKFVFHFLTVLLYSFTCLVLYRTLLLLFKQRGADYAAPMAWMASMLFAAHPIHTEVVANIKGCDEIVTLLGSLTALYCCLKSWDTGLMKWNIYAAISFFLACLAKENAVMFLFIIPLALHFFRAGTTSENKEGGNWSSLAGIWGAFILFFLIRGVILQWQFGNGSMELMNNPFLKFNGSAWVPFTFSEKLATNVFTLGKYVWLLFFPVTLTHDYYPRVIGIMGFDDPKVLLSLLLQIALVAYAIVGTRKKDPIAFGIWVYLLALSIVSNFVFPVGTNMGERFAFMPSVGFCIAIAALLMRFGSQTAFGITIAILALFSIKTISRNRIWESNEKLFLTDVAVSGNSAKIRNACGGVLFDKATKETDPNIRTSLFTEAVGHLNKALEIYPNYKDAYVSRGGCQFYLKNFEASIADYRLADKLSEGDPKPKSYLAIALRDGGKYYGEQKNDLTTAMRYLNESWQINPQDGETARLLGVANGVQGKHADAISWFSKAVELDPKNASFYYDLGTAYYASGDPVKGEEMRKKALEIDPAFLSKQGKQ